MDALRELVALSRAVGRREEDCAILGEGNTSARADDASFWVKASGTNLASIDEDGFVRVSFAGVLKLLEMDAPDAETIQRTYEESKVDKSQKRRPSVETLFHAVCLSLPSISFVAHTHPAAVNMLCCSRSFPKSLRGRMYPDEVVWLGVDSVFIPYVDPGVELARELHRATAAFRERHGESPKVIYMQNHGLVALGATKNAAESTTLTAVKAARVRLGAMSAGGIRLMPESEVRRIAGRPDEAYRIKAAETERERKR
jgi:rhamnose utilization protein RhaD (predicted bifunctional aldolase and dehydrogenase)